MSRNKLILAAGFLLLTTTRLATSLAATAPTDLLKAMNLPKEKASEKGTPSPEPVPEMLVRISEIEVYPDYLDEYLKFALTVGATSVREEPGVIAIYPLIQQRDSCQIRILEIYADQEAYRHHIGTRHFQAYKQGTLHMVKRLDLVDMIPLNPAAMPEIFRKLNSKNLRLRAKP